jgi:hypothetical protein
LIIGIPDDEFGIGVAAGTELTTTAPAGASVQLVKFTLKLGAVGGSDRNRANRIAAAKTTTVPATIPVLRNCVCIRQS